MGMVVSDRFFFVVTAVAVSFCGVPPAAGQTPTNDPEGWQDASAFLFNEANSFFARAGREAGLPPREVALGEAVTLLNVQPRTPGNISRSMEILRKLVAENANDREGLYARYFLARILAFHQSPPDFAAARELYQTLIRQQTNDPLVENGAAALVMMDLYENIPETERTARFERLESLVLLLQTSQGRRACHLALGWACLDFGESKSRAFAHLQAAEQEGISRWQDESAVWISLAELARAEGRDELAATYYRKFLAKYRRDGRSYTVAQRLAALENPSP